MAAQERSFLSTNETWLDDLVDSFVTTSIGMDMTTLQPIDCFSIHPLYSGEWIQFIQKIVTESEKQSISIKELSKFMPNPSSIRVQLYFLINDFRINKTPKKERLKLTRFFYEILKNQRIEDPFIRNKKNLLYSNEEALNKVKDSLLPANEDIAHRLSLIYLGGSHLVYGLYTDNYTDFGIEVHGPYDVSKEFGANHTLVIKELLNLKPVELFKETQKVMANNIQIYSVYEKVITKIDAASCHYSYEGNPIKGLRFWGLIVDGKPVIEKEQQTTLEQNLSENAVEQWQRITSLNETSLRQKMVEQRCYLFKEVCNRLKIDWKPSKKMLTAVIEKSLASELLQEIPKDKDQQREYWKRILDPRID